MFFIKCFHFSYRLISAYNSLTDKHLAGYFSNTQIRRHLRRAGLVGQHDDDADDGDGRYVSYSTGGSEAFSNTMRKLVK